MDKTVRVQQIVVTAKYLRNSSTATFVGFVVLSQYLSATRASKSCAFKEANLLSASIVALYSKDSIWTRNVVLTTLFLVQSIIIFYTRYVSIATYANALWNNTVQYRKLLYSNRPIRL